MTSVWRELRRRNVLKVAAAYIIVAWLLLQVSDTLVPALHLPEWFHSGVAFILIIGFPIALVLAWAFELTPDGLRKEKDIDRNQSITDVTGRKLNFAIIGLLVVTLGFFTFDKFVLDPDRDTVNIEAALRDAREQAAVPGASSDFSRSIAVLPFVNMSGDPDNEYFSDGLSEELLNLLAKVSELRVAARTSSFSFKENPEVNISEIASELNVAHVLEGSVRKSGNQIRITAQLINARDGYHLWSETYDRTLDNIFAIQDEIAAAVVAELKVTLLGDAPTARVTDPEAYALYLEGQYFANQRTAESMVTAIDLYRSALAIDPEYAPAWAELAYTYSWQTAIGGMPIRDGLILAEQAIEKSLAADPEYAFAFFARGVVRNFYHFDFEAGIGDYQRAAQLDPGSAIFIAAMGAGAKILGQYDEAIAHYHIARVLDPVTPEIHSLLAGAYWLSGRIDEALAAFEKTLSLSPNFSGTRYRRARILLSQGKHIEALAELEQEQSDIYRNTGLAMLHHATGNSQESDRFLNDLIANMADGAAFQIAEIYGFRDETENAFEWLDAAVSTNDSGIASVLGDPVFRGLFDDPRWELFLRNLGLHDAWLAMPPEHGGPSM